MGDDGIVEGVVEPGVEVAIEVGVRQHLGTFFAADIDVTGQCDFAVGQGAGFVGKQHIHGAKVLDGIEALDDDLLVRHGDGAFREVDRDDHRHHFGSEPNRNRRGKQKCFPPIMGS